MRLTVPPFHLCVCVVSACVCACAPGSIAADGGVRVSYTSVSLLFKQTLTGSLLAGKDGSLAAKIGLDLETIEAR